MKKKLMVFGAALAAGVILVSSVLEIASTILCGALLIGLAMMVIGLFPDIQDPPTNWPAGSHLSGDIDFTNEIAEDFAMLDQPSYGRWGDSIIGFRWSGKDADGKYAEYITWIEDNKISRQRVK